MRIKLLKHVTAKTGKGKGESMRTQEFYYLAQKDTGAPIKIEIDTPEGLIKVIGFESEESILKVLDDLEYDEIIKQSRINF